MSTVLALLLATPRAAACLCVGADATLLSPPSGATGVPTNARIWIWNWQGLTYDPDDLAPVDDQGNSLGSLEIVEHGREDAFLLEFRFTEELPPETFVQIVATSNGQEQFQFTTGDSPDHSPPTWEGKYKVDIGKEAHCDEKRWLSFFLEGMEDNSQQPVVVRLRPRGKGDYEIWGNEETTATRWSGQCGGEKSLKDSLQRSYDVTLFDVAGNELDGGVVSSCGGCDSGGKGAGLALVGMLGGWRRRKGRV